MLTVKPEDAKIVDTKGYGYFLMIEGTDGKLYNFFGNRPMNDAMLEKALNNCGLVRSDVAIVDYPW